MPVTTRNLLPLLALGTLTTSAVPLHAQRHRSDWEDRCESYSRHSRSKYCETRDITVRPGNGPLTVDGGRNGGVSVMGWDRDSIRVIAHIQATAGTPEEAQEVAQGIRVIASGRNLYPEGPGSGRNISWAVSFELWVPRHSDLSLTTANGPVEVEDVTGTMHLQAENGPVSLVGVGGEVQARSTNGPLHVQLTGSRWEGAGLDAETVNGPVNVEIPAGYSAQFETGTVNGPFDLDTPMLVTFQGRRYSRIRSLLGTGGAPVRAVTTNGPVQIRRG